MAIKHTSNLHDATLQVISNVINSLDPYYLPQKNGGRRIGIYNETDEVQDQSYLSYDMGRYIWEGEILHYDIGQKWTSRIKLQTKSLSHNKLISLLPMIKELDLRYNHWKNI